MQALDGPQPLIEVSGPDLRGGEFIFQGTYEGKELCSHKIGVLPMSPLTYDLEIHGSLESVGDHLHFSLSKRDGKPKTEYLTRSTRILRLRRIKLSPKGISHLVLGTVIFRPSRFYVYHVYTLLSLTWLTGRPRAGRAGFRCRVRCLHARS